MSQVALPLAGAEAHQLALQVATHAGQPAPALADTDAMLDNIEDCITVHACHGLPDTPVRAAPRDTFLPIYLRAGAVSLTATCLTDGSLDYSYPTV